MYNYLVVALFSNFLLASQLCVIHLVWESTTIAQTEISNVPLVRQNILVNKTVEI
jgi:hypothetical protein